MADLDFTDDELEAFANFCKLMTATQGPQPSGVMWRAMGIPNRRGLLMWLRLIESEQFVGDGFRNGLTLWRARRDDDEGLVEKRGHIWVTPATAVAQQAEDDRMDAEMRDMTPEEWAEIDSEVSEIERKHPGVWEKVKDEFERTDQFRPKPDDPA